MTCSCKSMAGPLTAFSLLLLAGSSRADVVVPGELDRLVHTDFATRLRFRTPDPVLGDFDRNALIADFAGSGRVLGVNMDAAAMQGAGTFQVFRFRTTAETYREPAVAWISFDGDRLATGIPGELAPGDLLPRPLAIGETRLGTSSGGPGATGGTPSPLPTPALAGTGGSSRDPRTVVDRTDPSRTSDPTVVVDKVRVAPEPSSGLLFVVGVASLAFGVAARRRLVTPGGNDPGTGRRSPGRASDRHAPAGG